MFLFSLLSLHVSLKGTKYVGATLHLTAKIRFGVSEISGR